MNASQLMSDVKFYNDYSRFDEESGAYESWDMAVDRVMSMHKTKYKDKMTPKLSALMEEVTTAYKNKEILGAQRALQFGGEQLLKKHAKMYNCTSTYADRAEFFGEALFLMLCGCGIGFSVQKQHVANLPNLVHRTKSVKKFVVPDSIEGWAEAIDVLFSSFFAIAKHQEYSQHPVWFDLSKIRPKGALISGGFKAPGPDSLQKTLTKIEALLTNAKERLRPIEVYDAVMYMADAVISGGVRRSATICMFSKDDEEMIKAKTGNWFVDNPQRGRSNNSVMLLRDECTFEEFNEIMTSVQHSGEPGFIFTSSLEHTYNPCVTAETPILTDKGYVPIIETIGEPTNIWNGKEWSEVVPFSTGINPLMRVLLSDGTHLDCTPYHKWVLEDESRVETRDLKNGYALGYFSSPDKFPDSVKNSYQRLVVKSVKYLEREEETYCFTEPKNNTGTFNGIVTGQCVEVGMLPKTSTKTTGWQACNLTELNGAKCDTPEKFYAACKTGSILGTIQAGYTDFGFLSPATKEIVDREALIGVGITGWMNNPEVLFDEEVMRKGAEIVKEYNKITADLIGINQAARTTVVKPSGNASVLLQTASGIHGEHSPRYIRHVQMNNSSEVLGTIKEMFPAMVEKSVWSNNGTDSVIAFPITTKEGSVYKKNLMGVKQLEYVKKAQQVWIEHGTNIELCTDPKLRHNVSNTISVDNWEGVTKYIYDNRQWFCGISLMSAMGDKGFPQAPFTEVLTDIEIVTKYGNASLFASGLVTRALDAFGDLWAATSCAMGYGEVLSEEDSHENINKKDWVRQFMKFAATHFNHDTNKTSDCLKDVYLLHKWVKIENSLTDIDIRDHLKQKDFVDVDTLGSQGCAGGACEVSF